MSRREFLRKLGMGAGAVVGMSVMQPFRMFAQDEKKVAPSRMTYRVQHGSGEQISLLGFGMMRLPNNQVLCGYEDVEPAPEPVGLRPV